MESNQKRLFLIYTLIIGVLGAYAFHLWHEKQAQFEQYYSLTQTEAKMNRILERVQDALGGDLYKGTQSYKTFINENLYRRSKFIQKHFEPKEKSIYTQIDGGNKGADSKGNYMSYLKSVLNLEPQISAFIEENKPFVDSIYQFAKNDPQALVGLDSIFSSTHHKHDQKIMTGGRNDQKAALLSIWELNHTSAACQIMASMENNIEGSLPEYHFETLIPITSVENRCVRAGEVFRGDVYIAAYLSDSTRNLTAFVNNKPITITQGLGQIHLRYQTPGVKKLDTKIMVGTPLTRELMFTKEFLIQICE